ncbi:MAG: aldo/keto reductase [Rhodospirillaceae bacterium]|nr:aldo/keto reductase [Rhodospirillaceae bacterium]
MSIVERRELAPGYTVSRLLKGGWHLALGHGAALDRQQAVRDMAEFVEAGITSFDCADRYQGVEDLIGTFRRTNPALAKRVQVHTKMVPDLKDLPTIKRADIEARVDRSRKRLGVETIDLVQFFWWKWSIPGAIDAALILADLKKAGKIRNIGVTNFSTGQLSQLIEAGVPIVSNQLQYSLVDDRPERAQIEYCRSKGIGLLTYGHLLGGFISESWIGAPEPAEPFANRSLRKYKLIIDDFGGWALFQELLGELRRIGEKYGVGPGEVALRWTLDRPGITGSIVGATSTRHLQRNIRVFDLELSDDDRAALAKIRARRRGPAGDCYEIESDWEGRHGKIITPNQIFHPENAPAA